MSTSEAMMGELRTDLCELGFMELIDYVHEFLPETAANMIAIKQLNRMWRFIAMMAAHWEGAIFCKCGKHMLLNPTKLQKPNAEKDAWCCDRYNCGNFCTCNIPKCLKNDDELQDQRIGGYPAFEFLAIDFGVCHENELSCELLDFLSWRQPNIDNVYFDSWPQDDVVAIRLKPHFRLNNEKEINNKLLERFGPRNLRLFLAGNAPISPTSLEKCGKLKWLDLYNAREHVHYKGKGLNMKKHVEPKYVNEETLSAIAKLPQMKRLALDECGWAPQKSFFGGWFARNNNSIKELSLQEIANTRIQHLSLKQIAKDGAHVEEISRMKSLVSLHLDSFSPPCTALATLVTNGTPLESLGLLEGYSPGGDIRTVASILTLRSLNMQHSIVRDSDIKLLVAKVPQLEALKLMCRDLHGDGFAELGKFHRLLSLTITGVIRDSVTPDIFNAALGNLTQLRVLDLSDSKVKKEHLQFLEKLRNVEVLSLCIVDDDSLSHLQSLTTLRILNLCGGHQFERLPITSDGIAHLSRLTEMESLNLGATQIDDKALQHISAMTKMRWLSLNSCDNITDEGLPFLRNMREVEYLDLAHCKQVTSAGVIRCLERMNKVKFVCHSCEFGGNDAIRQRCPHVVVQQYF